MKNRTVAFWIKWTLKRFAVMFLVSLGYGFFMGFINREEVMEVPLNQFQTIIVEGLPFYSFMLVFFVLILSTNYGEMVFPLSVGFSATRKDSFKGFQMSQLVMFFLDLVLIAPAILYYFQITWNGMAFFSSAKGIIWSLAVIITFLAFIFSLAQVGTALYIRTKGESLVWVRFGIAMVGLFVIMVSVFFFLQHGDRIFGNFVIPSVFAVISCGLYVAGFVWLRDEIRKLEVRL